jgi:diketogulonate reductase-like aldo/keto reductase
MVIRFPLLVWVHGKPNDLKHLNIKLTQFFNKRQSGEENDTVYRAVKAALADGYRHIDTAMMVTR